MRRRSPVGGPTACRRLAGVIAGLLCVAGTGVGWAGEVTFRAPSALLTTLPTKVTVTLTPSPSPEPVVVSLPVRPWRGPGEAVFLPGRVREVILTETATLEILGTVVSADAGGVLLAAMAGNSLLAAHAFTVVDPRMLTREQAIARARAALQPELAARPGLTLINSSIRLAGTVYQVGFRTPGWPAAGEEALHVQRWVTVDAFTGAVTRIGDRRQ